MLTKSLCYFSDDFFEFCKSWAYSKLLVNLNGHETPPSNLSRRSYTAMVHLAFLETWKFSCFLIVITFLLPKLNDLTKITCLFKEKGIYKIRRSLTQMIISCLGQNQKRTTTVKPKPSKTNKYFSSRWHAERNTICNFFSRFRKEVISMQWNIRKSFTEWISYANNLFLMGLLLLWRFWP